VECSRGVVAVSGGNHAQAVAYAARELGLRSLILMPEFTPINYLEATRAYGAEVVLTQNLSLAFQKVNEYMKDGWTYIHPFDDPLVIAGQGTISLEIFEDLPEVTDVIVSIGGGGLAGGIGISLKTLRQDVRIWGTETKGAESMHQALASNRVIQLDAITSIAKTLGAPAVSDTTLALAKRYLENVTIVSDEEAIDALFILLDDCKVLTEPAASCTLAALDKLQSHFSPNSHVVLVLCGGNFSVSDLCRLQLKTEPEAVTV
jgi:threonine dehydratase